MKIDFHCHTVKIKDGESEKRNCTASVFADKLADAGVGVAAITNHDYFDFKGFEDFRVACQAKNILLWPGMEMDVTLLNGSTGHCIIVANPDSLTQFNTIVTSLHLDDKTIAKAFAMDIKRIPVLLNSLDCFLIVHYGGKSPAFSPEDLAYLKEHMGGKSVFVEPTNLISAFVYLAHKDSSLIGSDCKDWDNYPGPNKALPELKTPISSFDNFGKLLRKDPDVIQTCLNKKKTMSSIPLSDREFTDFSLTMPIYNDVNIVFGGKSTGKSMILRDLKAYFVESEKKDVSFYSVDNKESSYDKVTSFIPSGEQEKVFEIPSFSDDLAFFQNFSSFKLPPIFSDLEAYLKNPKGELAQRVGFVGSITHFDSSKDVYETNLNALKSRILTLDSFPYTNYHDFLSEDEYKAFVYLFGVIKKNIQKKMDALFAGYYSCFYGNKCIRDFKMLYTKEKGVPTKPNETGLFELYQQSKAISAHALSAYSLLNCDLKQSKFKIGSLDWKGDVFVKGIFGVNPDELSKGCKQKNKDHSFAELRAIKADLKTLVGIAFSSESEAKSAHLAQVLADGQIKDSSSFFFYSSSLVDSLDAEVDPSNGEKSVLLLGSALFADKDIYILDEPEMSVGHDYVNRVIIPRIKELAKLNKIVIISTHDANIAVRTLPYSVLYREEDSSKHYHSYLGNPFVGSLIDSTNHRELSWRDKTLEVLEGGEEAFDERTLDYGK